MPPGEPGDYAGQLAVRIDLRNPYVKNAPLRILSVYIDAWPQIELRAIVYIVGRPDYLTCQFVKDVRSATANGSEK